MPAVLTDAVKTLGARPIRTLGQAFGVLLGACAFVVSLGVGQTVAAQVDSRFDVVKATTVSVTPAQTGDGTATSLTTFIGPEGLAAASRIAGVQGIVRYATADDRRMSYAPFGGVPATEPVTGTVLVADHQVMDVAQGVVRGSALDPLDDRGARQVALVGRALASELGITRPGGQVWVGGARVEVIGIVDDVARLPQALRSLIVSEPVARRAFPGARLHPAVMIRTAPGAAQVVATNLALALAPENPHRLDVSAPPSPEQLQRGVGQDVRLLSLAAAGLVLAAGVFAVGNLMLLNVTARVPEIGMRRAMGASAVQILALVLVEATVVGVLAGTAGSVLGTWTVLVVSIVNHWSPVLSLSTVWIGVLAGTLGAMLGGLLPALAAARVQPARALRS